MLTAVLCYLFCLVFNISVTIHANAHLLTKTIKSIHQCCYVSVFYT